MATGSISFGSGFYSGLDSKSIVDSLVAIKTNQIISPLEKRISQIQVRQKAFQAIKAAAEEFRTKTVSLKDPSEYIFRSKSATSSDTSKISIGAVNSSNALQGSYTISEVTQLAQADRILFTGVASKNSETFGGGTMTLQYKSVNYDITIDSSDTLEDIASAINSSDIAVTASIVNIGGTTPYQLVLTADETGADTTITLSSNPTSLAVNSASAESANQPFDASFKINTVAVSSSSNTVTEAVPGVSFTLLDTNATGSVTIAVKTGTSDIVKRIGEFVESFAKLRNELRTAILPNAQGKLGPLGSDSLVADMFYNVNKNFSQSILSLANNDYNSLAEIGITVDSNNQYTIDSAKLSDSIENNLENITLLFKGNSIFNGVANDSFNYIDILTQAGGMFADRKKTEDDNIKFMQNLITDREKQIEKYRDRITTKFNKLELVLGKLNASGSQLGSLSSVYSNPNSKLF